MTRLTTAELRHLIEVEREVEHWGQKHRITPLLVDAVLGDGKKLVGVQPLDTRPNYYVIRVDSGCDLSNFGERELFSDYLDEVCDAITEQFGERERNRETLIDEGCVPPEEADLANYEKELGWPSLCLDSGVSWFEVKWPKSKKCKQLPIRVGDKFKIGGHSWEVVGTKPGGRIELFDRERARFLDTYHRNVKTWERA